MAKKETTTTVSTRYREWVERIRGLQVKGRAILLDMYHAVCEFRSTGAWKGGPYQSFERCIDAEFGIHPQKWAHLEAAVDRFGEDWVSKYGYEVSTTMLRLEPKSDAEKRVIREIGQMEAVRGRPPSAESVARVVAQVVPPQRPVGSQPTEADRLRAEVRRLQGELKAAQRALLVERRARKKAEAALKCARRQKR